MTIESATYIGDLNAVYPAATDVKSEGDDHIRMLKATVKATFPGLSGAFSRVISKAAGYTMQVTDNTVLVDCSAALTLSYVTAATLGNQFSHTVYARGGAVILDPSGAETINGTSTLTIPIGQFATIWCNGSAFYAFTSDASFSNRQRIMNGGFTLNARGYVSAATLASGAYGHDRWKAGSGGGDYSFTQLASNTTITIAANKTLIQVIEDRVINETSFVLSWTGTAQARYAVNSATPAGAYASSPILITGQTVGTTMSVEFGNGASTGTLGNIKLEPGSVATAWEPYNGIFGGEEQACMRYYQANLSGQSFIWQGTTVAGSYGGRELFAVPMRVAPTMTATIDGAAGFSTGVITAYNIDTFGFAIAPTCTSAGDSRYFRGSFTATSEL